MLKKVKNIVPINFDDKNNLIEVFFKILKINNFNIHNITCFSYRSYFWFDYRLSNSNESEIHKILYNMMIEIKDEIKSVIVKDKEFVAEQELSFTPNEISV